MRLEVDAILFDIDGTLVDSTAAVERAWRKWSAARGIDALEVLRVCHGRRSEDTVAEYLPSDQRAAAVAELERLEMAELGDVTALPATRDLLSRLPSERWAAVTSGSQLLMRARLAAAGLPVPDILVAAEDVVLGKPDPQGYLNAARQLGFDPRRCLVVEDAPAGLEAGRAAGAHVLGVATSHPAHDLSAAHVVVPDLAACIVEVTAEGLVMSTAR